MFQKCLGTYKDLKKVNLKILTKMKSENNNLFVYLQVDTSSHFHPNSNNLLFP